MNKDLLLSLLLQQVERRADKYYDPLEMRLKDALFELNNRKEVALPQPLPKTAKPVIRALRKHFNNDVTRISLVLNRYFPDQYFFYRVSKLEPEIFAGFKFFSDIVPQFSFPFPKVGEKGIGRYLQLNQALLEYAHVTWPGLRKPQKKLAYFLYQGLGSLFLEKSDHRQYWVVSGSEDTSFDYLDKGKEVIWSGRKVMRPGDLVFMYRMAPRKAITDILQVKEEPYFEPIAAWDGFWVKLEKLSPIEDISIAAMREDPVIRQWSSLRKNFQGTVTEAIPPVVYNQLLQRTPEAVRVKYKLQPEVIPTWSIEEPGFPQPPTIPTPEFSGLFSLESEFEEKVVEPMLKQLGLTYQAQYACDLYTGSQVYAGRVDFLVSDQAGPLTLFENKFRILGDRDLMPAVNQAKSYALWLGLPSFVVASPEGMWLYALEQNRERLVQSRSSGRAGCDDGKGLKRMLLALRQQSRS